MSLRASGFLNGIGWMLTAWGIGFTLDLVARADNVTSPQWRYLMSVPGGEWSWVAVFGSGTVLLIAGMLSQAYKVRAFGCAVMAVGCGFDWGVLHGRTDHRPRPHHPRILALAPHHGSHDRWRGSEPEARLMVLTQLRRNIARFLTVLDSEGVALFQSVVYMHLAVAGLYCVVIAQGVPVVVQDALGDQFNTFWLALCMGATLCMIGRYFSRPVIHRFWLRTVGLYLQLAGDIAAAGAFYGYVAATIQESNWGKAVVAAWVFAALGDCAFLLVWRDIRRIKQAERRARL